MDNASDLQAIVRLLARYLRQHPHACDDADGICRWWFADGDAVTADELEIGLTWMKQHGLIDELVTADGRKRFRRCCADAQLDAVAQSGRDRNGSES